jgi:hypothetical protein
VDVYQCTFLNFNSAIKKVHEQFSLVQILNNIACSMKKRTLVILRVQGNHHNNSITTRSLEMGMAEAGL